MLYWISFGKWSNAGGPYFCAWRWYWKGYRWTPFVKLTKRYVKKATSGYPDTPPPRED